MNINDLPQDCLYLILGYVELCFYSEDDKPSLLSDLTKCKKCYDRVDLVKCSHLHEHEVVSKKMLKLVCRLWKKVIDERFVFTSGPTLNLNLTLN